MIKRHVRTRGIGCETSSYRLGLGRVKSNTYLILVGGKVATLQAVNGRGAKRCRKVAWVWSMRNSGALNKDLRRESPGRGLALKDKEDMRPQIWMGLSLIRKGARR